MNLTGSLIVGVLSAFIMMLMSKKAQRSRIEEDKLGNSTFRLPAYFLYLGIAMIVMTVIFSVLIPIKNNEDIFYSILLFGLFGIGGLSILLFYSSYLVNINDKEISFISTFKKEIRIKWEGIDSIVNKPNQGKLVVLAKKKRLVIHHQVMGFHQILDIIEKKKGITKQELNIK